MKRRGFTLLEVLVALAVFASAGIALMQATAAHLNALGQLEEITLANYVAGNRLAELQLKILWEELLARWRQPAPSPEQQAAWQRICTLLIDSALAQPKVLVHRDYMPRNLMLSEPNPGVLDFQDAVYGPVTYDVTCLFKDAFLSWPEARVQHWLQQYWQQASEAGVPVQPVWDDFLRASDLMGVQRHLKVIGIFARICHRDGKPRYLGDVPRFFSYIEAVLARRPELAELAELLGSLRREPV